jgi:hypothetical protein
MGPAPSPYGGGATDGRTRPAPGPPLPAARAAPPLPASRPATGHSSEIHVHLHGRVRRGHCRHPRPADSVKAGCKPAGFPARLLMGSPRPRAGRLGVAGSPRSPESCEGSRVAPPLVTPKQRDPLICYTPRSCCGRYHTDEQPGGAEVCPLPTRIVLSYLTHWAQRSRAQDRLPEMPARGASAGYGLYVYGLPL